VAAKTIVYASHHTGARFYVVMPSIKAIIGNKLFPGLLDHFLAPAGFKGQQTEESQDPTRPYNLHEPVPGDHGAHGRFDDRAKNFSPQLWTDLHCDALAAFALLGALVLAASLWVTRMPPDE
jgi:hypothetical protein